MNISFRVYPEFFILLSTISMAILIFISQTNGKKMFLVLATIMWNAASFPSSKCRYWNLQLLKKKYLKLRLKKALV